MEVHEGEIVGVGGLQGQGSSSSSSPSSASCTRPDDHVDGKPTRIRSPRDALHAGIGLALVPEDRQNQGLLLPKSVRENLTLAVARRFARYGLLDLRQERALVAEAVRQLNIVLASPEQPVAKPLRRQPAEGRDREAAAHARAVLLLYDLTRGVDVGTKGEIFHLMRDLAAQGYAILFFSTDMQGLVHVADRVAVLAGGRVSALLEGDAITEEAIIRASIAAEAEAA